MELLAARMHLPPPSAWFVPGAVCPMVFALGGRPRLLIPVALWRRLDVLQQSALLVHELAHLRRRDHWVRWLEIAVTVLYWWHPAVWWARRELREAEEQCCDAWVVWLLPGANRPYAAALLEAMEFISGPSIDHCIGTKHNDSVRRGVPAWASGMGEFYRLKRRLIMIKTASVSRRLTWAGLGSVLGLAGLVLPVAPAGFAQVEPASSASPDKPATEEGRVIQELRSRGGATAGRAVVGSEAAAGAEAAPPLPIAAGLPPAPSASSAAAPALAAPTALPPSPPQAKSSFDRGAEQQELQAARAEVQKLSVALQVATKRLQELEQARAMDMKSHAMRGRYGAMGTNETGGTHVVARDGKIIVYSSDGKILSVTEAGAQGANVPTVKAGPSADIQGYAPTAAPLGELGTAGGGQPSTAELQQRLSRLEAQMNGLVQDMRALHKELAARQAPPAAGGQGSPQMAR